MKTRFGLQTETLINAFQRGRWRWVEIIKLEIEVNVIYNLKINSLVLRLV